VATAARLRARADLLLLVGSILLSVLVLVGPSAPIAGFLRRTIVAPLVGLQQGSERWRNSWLNRESETLHRDSAALRAMNAQALVAENDQLRKLMGLGRRLGWGFIPAEALQTSVEQGLDLVTTLTLTAGSNAGVRKYSAVVAPEGLVGQVSTADPAMSIAILYTNPDFRASAMSGDRSAYGTVYPHQVGTNLRDRSYYLELRYVPFRSILKPGTPIYTAGLGGTYPPGIAIGTVLRELEAAEGLSRTYLLTPAVKPSDVTSVLILTPQRETQGVGNIWTAAVSTDSATHSIVAAGDSVARAAAALAERQRLATLDSVRRVVIDSLTKALGIPRADSTRRDSTATRDSIQLHRPARRDTTGRSVRDTTRPRPDTTMAPLERPR
jgi:rod shape-determining protein MreC